MQLTWRADVACATLTADVESQCGPHYHELEARVWLLLKATLYVVALHGYAVAIGQKFYLRQRFLSVAVDGQKRCIRWLMQRPRMPRPPGVAYLKKWPTAMLF